MQSGTIQISARGEIATNISEEIPFKRCLFNLTRLDIVATLDGEPPIPFVELREVCELTDGNLSSHLKVLEKEGLVVIHKGFNGKKPQTTVELSLKGREDFESLKNWFYQTFLE